MQFQVILPCRITYLSETAFSISAIKTKACNRLSPTSHLTSHPRPEGCKPKAIAFNEKKRETDGSGKALLLASTAITF